MASGDDAATMEAYMTTETEDDITTGEQLKTKLSGIVDRAKVGKAEAAEVLHSLLNKARGETGGPSAHGAGTPGAKQTPEEAKAQREREAKAAQSA
jgi:acetolactate synthase small subunit